MLLGGGLRSPSAFLVSLLLLTVLLVSLSLLKLIFIIIFTFLHLSQVYGELRWHYNFENISFHSFWIKLSMYSRRGLFLSLLLLLLL